MELPRHTRTLLTLIATVILAGGAAYSAAIDTSVRKGYGRINFAFDQPTKLRMDSRGTTATLRFDAPLSQSPDAIRSTLGDYVTGASLSADKRTLTLTLSRPYRMRQFVSGSTVGVDIVGEAAGAQAPEKPPTEPASEPAAGVDTPPEAATPKPTNAPEDLSGDAAAEPEEAVAPKPAAPPAPAKKPGAAAKAEAMKTPQPVKAKPEPVPEKPIAERVKEAGKPVVKAAAPVDPVVTEPAVDPMLTTKVPEPEPKKPSATPASPAPTPPAVAPVKTVEPVPAATNPMLTTKTPEPAPAEAPKVDDDVDTATPLAEEPAPVPEAAALVPGPAPASATPIEAPTTTAPSGPFIVSARTVNSETIINFPFTDRTAAAVFRRANHIWIVFSQAKDANAKLLSTVMPRQVISVTQYRHAGNTVLHLVTDGSLHARATQVSGGYGWDVTLSSSPPSPTLDTSISADNLEGQSRLLLSVFDVAEPVRFYDPAIGDQLVIIPAFENGRGISSERNYPQFTILNAQQGVAIVSRVADIVTSQSRAGFILATKDGLAVSENLPTLGVRGVTPISGVSANSGVMMPYDQWFVPRDKFMATLYERMQALATATTATKPDALMELVKLHLADGRAVEANGYLKLIASQYPEYYRANKLAMLSGATNVLMRRYPEAASDLAAEELTDIEEAAMWRQIVALNAPPPSTAQTIQQSLLQSATPSDSVNNTAPVEGEEPAPVVAPPPPPEFHFLKFNKPYIRFYPPPIRHQLAVIAADAYIADGQEEKALAVYDTLIRDNILGPVKHHAEFALGMVAQKKVQTDQALQVFDRLSKQVDDPYIAARARYAAAMLRYKKNSLTPAQTAEILESTRMTWRADKLERDMMVSLIELYKDAKRYDEVLRTQKALLDAFRNDPDTLSISVDMSELFASIFLDGLAEEMPPLKALSLFYEFRELTPIGERGDLIIQRLADRLAAFDLLDRATQLLEHQIKFRVSGEQRSQIGARLALLHLLNDRPKEALSVLEVTNFGGNNAELQTQRLQLTAEALMRLEKYEEALGVLYNDTTKVGALLRLDVLWAMRDWPNVVNRAEDILNARNNLTEPLTTGETDVLLKLALAYSFEGDFTQLRYLRDYYSGLIPDSGYKQVFDFITNDTTPLDTEDSSMLTEQINRTESFLGTFREKIAAGKLSETIQ